jgi:hypothetical protein
MLGRDTDTATREQGGKYVGDTYVECIVRELEAPGVPSHGKEAEVGSNTGDYSAMLEHHTLRFAGTTGRKNDPRHISGPH